MADPEHPLRFSKGDTALRGPGSSVEIPAFAGRVVFEGELGIVIGRTCKDVGQEEAGTAILRCPCINKSISLDIVHANPSMAQWIRATSFDDFGAVGPGIEMALDWRVLTVKVRVNGREWQTKPGDDMILRAVQVVSRPSRDMTLNPGDVIACCTSLGARPVKPGMGTEVVTDEIVTLGVTMAPPAH